MTAEELLVPRIKVIAPAPLMINKVGDFLTRFDHEDDFDFGIKTIMAEHFHSMKEFKEWPYIFKICKWWEDRNPEDMPGYVKLIYNNKIYFVHKVVKWIGNNTEEQPLYKYHNLVGTLMTACVRELEPATEQEYNDFINSK